MQPRTTNQIRLHYRDVSALINLIENDYDITELNSEEQHAYFRLREMRAALESYEAHKNRKALLNSNENKTESQDSSQGSTKER
jgi:hypothetical protein